MPISRPFGFAKSKAKAERYAQDEKRASELLSDMMQKAVKHRHQLSSIWYDLMTLYRLLRAWTKGNYRTIPWKSIVWALAAIVYFVNPLDMVPDFIPGIGYLDDAVVIGFVMNSIRKDVSKFREWERGTSSTN